MLLILLILSPVLASLLCLAANSRVWWERLNLAAFGTVCGLSIEVGREVAAQGPISIWAGFLRVDALSALVIGLTGFVSLACAIYAVGFFRQDQLEGRITVRQ